MYRNAFSVCGPSSPGPESKLSSAPKSPSEVSLRQMNLQLTQDCPLHTFDLTCNCMIPGRANFRGKDISEPWVPRRKVLGDQKSDFLSVSLSLPDKGTASASFPTRWGPATVFALLRKTTHPAAPLLLRQQVPGPEHDTPLRTHMIGVRREVDVVGGDGRLFSLPRAQAGVSSEP